MLRTYASVVRGQQDCLRSTSLFLIATAVLSLTAAACTDSNSPLTPSSILKNGVFSVAVNSPAAGSTVSGTVDVTVTTDASNGQTVAGVQFKVDGANIGGEDTTAPYSMAWNTATTANGSHTLTAVARNATGAVVTSPVVAVTVSNGAAASDSAAPSVSLTSPSGGATVSGSLTVSANATDNVGVAGVQFKLDGANLGDEDTALPYATGWDTRQTANGSHTLTAVARDAAGHVTTSAAVTVTVSNGSAPPSSGTPPPSGGTPPPSNTAPAPTPPPAPPSTPPPPPPSAPPSSSGGPWPNEPVGFRILNDQSWDSLTGNGWNFAERTGGGQDAIVSDGSAPFSPSNVLRIDFTPNMSRDSEPSVHWMGLPQPREIYTGWWMKLSSNWTPSPAGGGKITFLWAPDGQGQVYSNIGGSSAPHRIYINTEWAPYGQNIWEPNVSLTPINYDQWYRIEWYVKWESSPGAGDGIMRWWVNGVLNGDYRNVRFPGCCFQQFEFAPTMQLPPPTEQFMFIDHTRVSVP